MNRNGNLTKRKSRQYSIYMNFNVNFTLILSFDVKFLAKPKKCIETRAKYIWLGKLTQLHLLNSISTNVKDTK